VIMCSPVCCLCVCWRIETDCIDVVTWWCTYTIFCVDNSYRLSQQNMRLCERWSVTLCRSVCLFVCLSVARYLKRLWLDFHGNDTSWLERNTLISFSRLVLKIGRIASHFRFCRLDQSYWRS